MNKLRIIAAGILLSAGLVAYAASSNERNNVQENCNQSCTQTATCDAPCDSTLCDADGCCPFNCSASCMPCK